MWQEGELTNCSSLHKVTNTSKFQEKFMAGLEAGRKVLNLVTRGIYKFDYVIVYYCIYLSMSLFTCI